MNCSILHWRLFHYALTSCCPLVSAVPTICQWRGRFKYLPPPDHCCILQICGLRMDLLVDFDPHGMCTKFEIATLTFKALETCLYHLPCPAVMSVCCYQSFTLFCVQTSSICGSALLVNLIFHISAGSFSFKFYS